MLFDKGLRELCVYWKDNFGYWLMMGERSLASNSYNIVGVYKISNELYKKRVG